MEINKELDFCNELLNVSRLPCGKRPAALDAMIQKINHSYTKGQFFSDMRTGRWKEAFGQFNELLVRKSLIVMIRNSPQHRNGDGFELWDYNRLEWPNGMGTAHKQYIIRWAGLTKDHWREVLGGAALCLLPSYGLMGALSLGAAIAAVYRAWTYLMVFDLDVRQHAPALYASR